MNDKMTELTKVLEKAYKANIPNEWESSVPVVSDGNRHFVYICSDISDPSNYSKLCHMLYNAKEYDEFILNINSPGGVVDSALMIIDAIKASPAKVSARLTGTVASAATLITMACDEIYPTQGLSFMIHNYSSSGMQGKGHEMKARQQFMDRQLNRAFRDYYIGFLTEEEMSDIIEGKDIWLDHEEVLERWALKKSFIQ